MNSKCKAEQSDEENPEWTAEHMASARAAQEVLPELFGAVRAQEMLKPRGRPRAEQTKEKINIRLSHDVLEHFKAGGSGWQTRIDAALQQYIAEHASH